MAFRLIALLGLTLATGMAAAQEFRAGEHYRVLDQPVATAEGEGVEVREFFSYGCPHCHDFEPLFAAWAERMGETVNVVHTPVTFNREAWALLARAYHAAEVLEITDAVHRAVFEAIHVEGRRFRDEDDIAAFLAGVAEVDEQTVRDTLDSFAVDSRLRRSERLGGDYSIRSTPTVTVAGRYVIDVRQAGGQQGMLEVAEYLVREEAAAQ